MAKKPTALGSKYTFHPIGRLEELPLNENKTTNTCVTEGHDMPKLPPLLGRLLCWFGYHDFRVVDRAFEFGAGGGIEKVECRRCGATTTRRA